MDQDGIQPGISVSFIHGGQFLEVYVLDIVPLVVRSTIHVCLMPIFMPCLSLPLYPLSPTAGSYPSSAVSC